ncbi:hypothetical protein [Tsuneonella sp. HG222]
MDVIEPGTSGRDETDAVAGSYKWAGTTISFSFPTLAGYADYGGTGEPTLEFAVFTPAQQAAVREILAQVSRFSGLTFVELTGAEAGTATLRFGRTSVSSVDIYSSYSPSSDPRGGDVWSSNFDFFAPAPGNKQWYLLTIEIGHALGLDYTRQASPQLDQDLDWMSYTVMSERAWKPTARDDYSYVSTWSYPQTFMREDIAALQFLYGAGFNGRTGDNTYRVDPVTGELFVDGIGQGVPNGNKVFFTLWDGGGVDTFDFSGFGKGLGLNFQPGGTIQLTDAIEPKLAINDLVDWGIVNALSYHGDTRSLIENIIGTAFNDYIAGNAADNILLGGEGRDFLAGYEGADFIDLGPGDNRGYGGPGNDTIIGYDGNDEIYGDDGDDYIDPGNGRNIVAAGSGNDRIFGGLQDDNIDGGDDNDLIIGGFGFDYLDGGQGDDEIHGGPDNDTIGGGGGNDRLFGDDGNDWVYGWGNDDYMVGGLGDDTYQVDSPGDVIVEFEGEGYDWVSASINYTLPLQVEAISVNGSPDGTKATGNERDNVMVGGWNSEIFDGMGGRDIMRGGPGDDTYYVDNPEDKVWEFQRLDFVPVIGTPNLYGNDTVYSTVSYVLDSTTEAVTAHFNLIYDPTYLGGAENLILIGSGNLNATGNLLDNKLLGNGSNNILSGLAGNDILVGGTGEDALFGGAGIDTASYEGDEGGVFVNLSLGRGYGNASFGDTYDSIENVIGTAYNDFLIGDPGLNRLDGAGGDDTIVGAVGADVIIGGSGFDWASYEDNSGVVFINLTLAKGYNNAAEGDTYEGVEHLVGGLMDDFFIGNDGANRLNGAMGADTLLGAGGADIFMFTYAPGATSIWGNPNVDLILDFATGVDRIELGAAAFPGLPVGTLAAGAFWAGTAAHDGDDRILYDAGTGKLFFDPDGTGGQAALLFAVLGETSHPAALAASDFVVV